MRRPWPLTPRFILPFIVALTGCAQPERLPDAPPFLLISASPEAPQVSARLGAAGFLTKPCYLEELDDALDRIVPFRAIGRLEDAPTAPVEPAREK